MARSTLVLSAFLMGLSGLAYACGDSALSAFQDPTSRRDDGGVADAGAPGEAALSPGGGQDLTPVDNAVILVHAAKTQSFRLCFEAETDRRPQPDSQVMPEANVVGVEVGSAVRLGPLRGAPGRVFLFEEPLIRGSYPAFGGTAVGPSCQELLDSDYFGPLAQDLGAVTTNLSTGVHLLVVRGCPKNSPLTKYSVAECGAGWAPDTANLRVTEITLPGVARAAPNVLPAQVVNLSQPLESARAGRDVVVTFGDLTQANAPQAAVVSNPVLFGGAAPPNPAPLGYEPADIASYASLGFRVSLVPADGGPGTTVLDDSLAHIQKLSSPRDVPPPYYAAASNYVLLLLGNPAAKLEDGGPDDDARRNLHILAVPVIQPKDDAGSEDDGGGSTEPVDGGAAPP